MKKTASDAKQAVRFEARIWREAFDTTQEQRDPITREYKEVPIHYEASWAVYHVATGVRMNYSKDEASAKATAEKWNSGKLPLAMANKAESASDLRKLLGPGDTVQTILRNVSRSGMQRRISLVVANGNQIEDITWDAARVMGDKVMQGGKYVQDAGMVVSGCGMDMGFHVVYNLGRTLFPDGFAYTELGIRNHVDGKSVNVNIGRGRDAGPLRREEIADMVSRGWTFPGGRNGDKSGWDTDGGYALKQRWL